MKRILAALLACAANAAQALAQSPPYPPSMPPRTVVGNMSTVAGPGRAVQVAQLQALMLYGETPVSDANYSLVAADRTVAYTALTAARTVTLLPAASYAPGTQIYVFDRSGNASSSKAISIAPTGADLINGANATYTVIISPYVIAVLETDGVSKWTASAALSTSAAPFLTPNAFPGPGVPYPNATISSGQILPYLNENVAWTGNGVFPFQIVATNPYAVGTNATIGSSTVGQIFRLIFTSTHLTGSPITITYVAVGGDTVSTIGVNLCAAVNANTTLHNTATSLPLFCQSINQTSPGLFNLQWDVSYTDLTVTSTGSTGTITGLAGPTRTLDFAVTIFGRRIPGYSGQAGDAIHCLQFMGQSNSLEMDAVASQDCSSLINATGGSITGRRVFSTLVNSVNLAQIGLQSGVVLYDASNNLPTSGFLGNGTLNIPLTGGLYIAGGAGGQFVNGALIVNNVFGGGATNSALNLQSTQSGSPSGDFVQITAGNKVGFKFDGTNSTFGTSGTLVGSACFANATSGTICLKPPTGALGSAVLTLPDTTDTLIAKATTDILTNKTYDTAGTGNVFKINGNTVSAVTGTGSTVALSAGPTFTGTVTGDTLTSTGNIIGSGNLTITRASGVLSNSLTATASQVQVSYTGSSGVLYLFKDSAAGSNQKFFELLTGGGSTSLSDLTDAGAIQHTYFTFTHSTGVASMPGAIASTSTTTGTLTVTGGVGVSGAIYAGGELVTGITTVGGLPTCNAAHKGARYFVTDQNTAVAYHGAVTGSGASQQGVTCDGTNWYQS